MAATHLTTIREIMRRGGGPDDDAEAAVDAERECGAARPGRRTANRRGLLISADQNGIMARLRWRAAAGSASSALAVPAPIE